MKGEQEQAKVCVGGGAINTPASLTVAGGSLEGPPPARGPISSFIQASPTRKPSTLVSTCCPSCSHGHLPPPETPRLQSEGDTVMHAAQLGFRSPSPEARL